MFRRPWHGFFLAPTFGPARGVARGFAWSVRFAALGALYFVAGTSAVLLIGAVVFLPGALMFGFADPKAAAAAPAVLMMIPSFVALFAAMSGLLRTVESAESSLSLWTLGRKERATGQLSLSPSTDERRGRLSLIIDG